MADHWVGASGTRLGRRYIACVVLAGRFAVGAITAGNIADAAPANHVVTIENLRFNPSTLTVQRGDRVTWINKDLFPHTASASTQAFDSRDIAPGATWAYTASRQGRYPYFCRFHPGMQGILSVQ